MIPTKPKRTLRKWREALTSEEAQQIAPMEARMAKIRDELLILCARYHRIQNRASVRAGKPSDERDRRGSE